MAGINLKKNVEQVGIVLKKRKVLTPPTARVGVALDVSGSARDLYRDGTIQETLDRLMALALTFDDNGELDVWAFDTHSHELPGADENSYETYVRDEILNNRNLWGGTNYAPVWRDVISFYDEKPVAKVTETATGVVAKIAGWFGGKKAETTAAPTTEPTKLDPAVVLFITDGANADRGEAERVMAEAAGSGTPIYWVFVGVGSASHFSFLRELADKYPNAGFLNLESLNISEEALYEQLITEEFVTWLTK